MKTQKHGKVGKNYGSKKHLRRDMQLSTATIDGIVRSVERTTRQAGKKQIKEEVAEVRMTFSDALKIFGPFHKLGSDKQFSAKPEHVLCVTMTDIEEEDEEGEPFESVVFEGFVGPRLVNVEYRFLTSEPMPMHLVFECDSSEEIENCVK